MKGTIDVEQESSVSILTINRPEQYNALTPDMMSALATELQEISMVKGVLGVVITGVGKAFSPGADLKWANNQSAGLVSAFRELVTPFHRLITGIRRLPIPVVAAINGLAAGGGFAIALACDFRVMAKTATLKQAYTSNGLSPDGGTTFMLPRIVGLAKSLEILAFDRPFDSKSALEWGLVNRVVDDDIVVTSAIEMVQDVASGSLHSFEMSKQLINDSFSASFEVQLETERSCLLRAAAHQHASEGIRAFIEKRKAVYGNLE